MVCKPESRIGVVLLLSLSSVGHLAAQAPADGTATRVRAHMEFLADDLLEGRAAGTRGYDVAARYAASQLRVSGFQPAGDDGTFMQRIPLRQARLTEATLTARRGDGAQVTLDLPREAILVPDLARTQLDVTAPAVYAGFGVTAPERQYDDYAKIDARGKIVVILLDAPTAFPSEVRAHYSDTKTKLQNAVAHGAVGVLAFVSPSKLKSFPWEAVASELSRGLMQWMQPDGRPANHHPELRGRGILHPSGAEKLFAPSVSMAQVVADAEKGAPHPFDLSTTVSIRTASAHRDLSTPNVIGRLEGGDPVLRRTNVVLTAHLDHTGMRESGSGDRINNGAFDNAAGCAVLLEVARLLAQGERPLRSVVVLFVGAEEQGLVGSDYFAQHPTIARDSIVANVNLDMPLLQWPFKDVVAFGSEHSSLGPLTERALRPRGIGLAPDPMPNENIFVRSDQYSFVKRGIPAIALMPAFTTTDAGRDPAGLFQKFLATNYHQPSDDLSQPLDETAVTSFTRINHDVALAIANDRQPPTWNRGDFFGEMFRPKR